MLKDQEDLILINDILNGDGIAEEKLYNKYRKVIESFIKNKYKSGCDIEDDVSEIMIKIFLNIKTFNSSIAQFNSWVLTIAKNYMIDKWRCNSMKLTSTNTISIDWSEINSTSTSGNSPFTFTSNCTCSGNIQYSSSNTCFENCDSINYITTQLSPTDYTLLNMKYMQGYNYCEIGKEFNLTSSTVSNKVNYIKTKLKKNLSEIIDE